MTKPLFPQFEPTPPSSGDVPLADRMRPETLEEVVGQDLLLGEGRFLREAIRIDKPPSMILWGPPGVGKTTLARVIARHTKAHFVALSAVLSGVKEVKQVVADAEAQKKAFGKHTILFVDEIHRFSKSQQDAFLPHVEAGTVTLIGGTTENPSFEVIAPLLSRTRVLVLEPLQEGHLVAILRRAVDDPIRGLGGTRLVADDLTLRQIAAFANGDARMALNSLEAACQLALATSPQAPCLTPEIVLEALQKRTLLYDKTGESHYNLISALHKSLRNSDADASLYWLGRMLEAGEDPLYVARRMVRFASEDVGLADPAALGLALDATRAVQFIGMPEGKLALAQLAVYLAQAPKSNSIYRAYGEVSRDVEETRNDPVPLALRNAPTPLMKGLGYGQGYRYAHDEPEGVADLQCLPPLLADRRYYQPKDSGFEIEIGRRLREVEKRRRKRGQP